MCVMVLLNGQWIKNISELADAIGWDNVVFDHEGSEDEYIGYPEDTCLCVVDIYATAIKAKMLATEDDEDSMTYHFTPLPSSVS